MTRHDVYAVLVGLWFAALILAFVLTKELPA